jgi:hypothetical protein
MLAAASLATLLLAAPALAAAGAAPVNLIIDTDMSTDCDDVAALCLAHALVDRGEAELLAVLHNTGLDTGVCAVSAINTYYGRPATPVGAYQGSFAAGERGQYADDLCSRFPAALHNKSEAPAALGVYRAALAAAPDGSVVIASIGFSTNLQALLLSGPDAHSPLGGAALVRRKVREAAWMGGGFPRTGAGTALPRGEWNFAHNGDPFVGASTNATLGAWPAAVPRTFAGFEVGVDVMTGAVLTNGSAAANPCRAAFIDLQGPATNRSSFDPLTVLYAVRGAGAFWTRGAAGHNAVGTDGLNVWEASGGGAQSGESYLVQAAPPDAVAAAIDALLLQPPRASLPPTPPPPSLANVPRIAVSRVRNT